MTNLLKETVSLRHFDLHQDTKIVNDIKEDTCFVSSDLKADLDRAWKGSKNKQSTAPQLDRDITKNGVETTENSVQIDYVLPDGVTLLRGFSRTYDPSTAAARKRKLGLTTQENNEVVMTLGNERFSVPEVMFNPSDIGSQQPGIAECVLQSLSKLPPLVQATMLANTIVIGGNAKMVGFVERLESELRAKVKSEWQVNVRRMADPTTSTWLGGARLACNHHKTVEEHAVTKAQYLEFGSSWLLRKFALPD